MKSKTGVGGWMAIVTVGLLTQAMVMEAQTQVGWSPADRIESVNAWYDASAAATITVSGNNVTSWNDKSGNNYHLTVTEDGSQPSNDGDELNGHATIEFGEADGYIATEGTLPSAFYGDVSVYMVLKSDRSAYGGSTVDNPLSATTLNDSWAIMTVNEFRVPAAKIAMLLPAGTGDIDFTGINGLGVPADPLDDSGPTMNRLPDAFAVLSFVFDSPDVSVSNPARLTMGKRYADRGTGAHCSIAEVIIVSGKDSEADRQKMEGYLAWKWRLGDNLVADHPYTAAKGGRDVFFPPSPSVIRFR